MTHTSYRLKTSACLLVFVLSLSLPAGLWAAKSVAALTLTSRSVEVSTAVPLAAAAHDFRFTYGSTTNVGSVVFEYCDNSPVFSYACNPPGGLDVESAVLVNQTGNTGFSIDAVNTVANKIVLSRAPAPSAAVASLYSFSGITNPSTGGQTIFIRISTYASADGSGQFTDNGAVAFATIAPFNVNTDVPPFIKICVGVSVAADCTSAIGDRVNLGILSPNGAKSGQSQFASGTNSITGYNVFVFGTTLTSGVNVIPAMASASSSQPGSSQFGINLRANTNPSVGQEPGGAGTASPTAGYGTANIFKYASGDALLNSSMPSDYNRITISYIANISPGQDPGVYATTFTYMATADF